MNVVDGGVMGVCCSFLAFLSVLLFFQIVCRYFFEISYAWALELCRYLFIWIIFLGSYLAWKKNQHFKFTLIEEYAPEKVRKALNAVAFLLGLFFWAFVLISGSVAMKDLISVEATTLNIKLGYVFLVILVCAALILIDFLEKIYHFTVTSILHK